MDNENEKIWNDIDIKTKIYDHGNTSIKITNLATEKLIDDKYNEDIKISVDDFKTNITKQEFEAYEKVKVSGVINMLAVDIVSKFSKLSIKQVEKIMFSYNRLKKKYNS